MISKTVLAALVAGAFAFGLPTAQAQFTGGTNVTPVEKVLSQGRDDQYVAVEGFMVPKTTFSGTRQVKSMLKLKTEYSLVNRFLLQPKFF